MPSSSLLLFLGLQNIPLELDMSTFVTQGRVSVSGSALTESQFLLQSLAFFCAQYTHCFPTFPPVPCVSPQRAWQEADKDLRATQQVLEEAKARLREVEDGIATLQAKYKTCIAKKEELEMKCEQCQQRLGRADTVRDRAGFCLLTWDNLISGQAAQGGKRLRVCSS